MQYAGFWRRYVAAVIDSLILIIPVIALNYLVPFAGGLITLFYKPIFEASPLRGTPGKSIMGMVVVTEGGARISLKQAYIRYAASILSAVIMMIGYLMALFTERKQTLHDLIAETVVVNEVARPVNFFQIWLDQMKVLFGQLENPAPVKQATDSMKTLEQLHQLLLSGAITQDEFNQKKEEILKKI